MEGELLLQMLSVAQRMRRELRDFARYNGMSNTEMIALHFIASGTCHWDGPSLARRLGCSRIHAFRVARSLVRLGFARIEIDPMHPHYAPVGVTNRGRDTYERALHALEAHCFWYLSPDDKRQLHLLLSRMRTREPMRLLID